MTRSWSWLARKLFSRSLSEWQQPLSESIGFQVVTQCMVIQNVCLPLIFTSNACIWCCKDYLRHWRWCYVCSCQNNHSSLEAAAGYRTTGGDNLTITIHACSYSSCCTISIAFMHNTERWKCCTVHACNQLETLGNKLLWLLSSLLRSSFKGEGA